MYPYWCVEKGYARFVGPRDGTAAWAARARGWIRVMHLDIVCSMVIYTMATVAFYLLGAGVLHRHGRRARRARHDPGALEASTRRRSAAGRCGCSMLGAVVTLYGTIFAATAAHSRLFADAVRVAGVTRATTPARRLRWRNLLRRRPRRSCRRVLYWFIASPVQMVVAGGIAQALMLPLIGIAADLPAPPHLPRRHPAHAGHDRFALDSDDRDRGIRGVLRREPVGVDLVVSGLLLRHGRRPCASRCTTSRLTKARFRNLIRRTIMPSCRRAQR